MPPKRKGEAIATPKNAKKAKITDASKSQSPQSKASSSEASAKTKTKTKTTASLSKKSVKAPAIDDQFEWEILGGDNRDTLLTGTAAPERLTIKLRHRHNKKEQPLTFTYKKKSVDEINWQSKRDIADINKWRNEVFTGKMRFTPKVVHTLWTSFETGYLELFHKKLLKAAATKKNFVVPHNVKISEAFNEYFEDRDDIRDENSKSVGPLPKRSTTSLQSYLNRPGTKIRDLRDQLVNFKKSNGDDAYLPTITDKEIEDHIKATAKKTGQEQGNEGQEGQDTDTSSELSDPPEGLNKELKSDEASERGRQGVREKVSTEGKASKPTKAKPTTAKPTTTKPTTAKPTTAKPTATKPPANKPVTNTKTPKKPGVQPPSTLIPDKVIRKPTSTRNPMSDSRKPTNPDLAKGKAQWVKPAETKVVPDSPEVLAAAKRAGWKWTEMPSSNEEALKQYRDAKKKKPVDTTWVDGARKDLDDRIERHTSPGFKYELFYKDAQENYEGKGAMVDVEDWHEKSARREGAAEVTALLNTADIPPLGYTGDIRALHKERLLSEDELAVADARDAAITEKHQAVERARKMKIERDSGDGDLRTKHDEATRKQRESLYYDSDITDVTDDEGEEIDESMNDPKTH